MTAQLVNMVAVSANALLKYADLCETAEESRPNVVLQLKATDLTARFRLWKNTAAGVDQTDISLQARSLQNILARAKREEISVICDNCLPSAQSATPRSPPAAPSLPDELRQAPANLRTPLARLREELLPIFSWTNIDGTYLDRGIIQAIQEELCGFFGRPFAKHLTRERIAKIYDRAEAYAIVHSRLINIERETSTEYGPNATAQAMGNEFSKDWAERPVLIPKRALAIRRARVIANAKSQAYPGAFFRRYESSFLQTRYSCNLAGARELDRDITEWLTARGIINKPLLCTQMLTVADEAIDIAACRAASAALGKFLEGNVESRIERLTIAASLKTVIDVKIGSLIR